VFQSLPAQLGLSQMQSFLTAMKINRGWQSSFWLLVLVTLWLSLIPVDQVPKAFNFWDKAQ
jgi:hypothetical protein